MSYQKRWVAFLAATILSTGGGCDNGSVSVSGSSEEANVKGTVTIQGKPATGGEVVFDPVNVNRRNATQRRAPIGKDGTFTITTLVGDNMAIVEGPEIIKANLTVANRQRVDVASGENTVDLAVPAVTQTGPPATKKSARRTK